MHTMRSPAVAGTFYPADIELLRREVRSFLNAVSSTVTRTKIDQSPKALIVPHAGYRYSGMTAASAYAMIDPSIVTRIVLLGPAHRVHVEGLALPESEFFATPLGKVKLELETMQKLSALSQVERNENAHAHEHSIEVHLPFLQTILKDFSLIPLVVGHASANEVAEVLEMLWGGSETLILISSDLSHFLPDGQARLTDQDTLQHILFKTPLHSYQQACGAVIINGLLLAARHHSLDPVLLSTSNSGDSSGDRSRVVGYASVAFLENNSQV